jgi:hypothetical protein
LPYVGARSPETLDIVVATVDGFDLNAVTLLEISVKGPAGKTLPWSWSIVSKTATEIVIRHEFSVDGKDATAPGKYTITGWLLVGSSTRRRLKPVSVQFDTYG